MAKQLPSSLITYASCEMLHHLKKKISILMEKACHFTHSQILCIIHLLTFFFFRLLRTLRGGSCGKSLVALGVQFH